MRRTQQPVAGRSKCLIRDSEHVQRVGVNLVRCSLRLSDAKAFEGVQECDAAIDQQRFATRQVDVLLPERRHVVVHEAVVDATVAL